MLKKYKKVHKLTWEELANKIGISREHLHKIIKDKSPFIRMDTAIKIWEATGLSPYDYIPEFRKMLKSRQKSS